MEKDFLKVISCIKTVAILRGFVIEKKALTLSLSRDDNSLERKRQYGQDTTKQH